MKNTRGKVPAGPKAQPGRVGKLPSSTKQPKAVGIQPGKPSWGILHGGNQSGDKLRAKANRLFGTGSRNVPTGQARIETKAKRQVY